MDVTTKGDCHPTFAILHENKIVARTGTRRGKRDQPVKHVSKDLRVSPRFVLEMASCTKYREDWLKEVGIVKEKEKGEDEKGKEDKPENQ